MFWIRGGQIKIVHHDHIVLDKLDTEGVGETKDSDMVGQHVVHGFGAPGTMDLAPIGPLGGPSGPLSGSTRPLLGPGLGPAPVGVDHLLDGLGVVVVDGVVGLLPDNVLVDEVNTGIHGPHVRVQAQ